MMSPNRWWRITDDDDKAGWFSALSALMRHVKAEGRVCEDVRL